MVTAAIAFVAGAVTAVVVPKVYVFVAKQIGWVKAKV